jgi:Nucleoside 2-deoxyribosyltransferase like
LTARYVEAPTYYKPAENDPPAVFLAGGITGVTDWQASAATALASDACVVLNPRRAHFPVGDPTATDEQVRWECHHRRLPRLIMLIWFPSCDPVVTVQPIVLLELGAELARRRSPHRGLVIGTDPAYPRRLDVVLQCRYERPDVVVHDTLGATVRAAQNLLPQISRRDRDAG